MRVFECFVVGSFVACVLLPNPAEAQSRSEERIQWIDMQTSQLAKAPWPNCKGLDPRKEPCFPEGEVRGAHGVMVLHPLDKDYGAWLLNVAQLDRERVASLEVEVASPLKERACKSVDFILSVYLKVVGTTEWIKLLPPTIVSWEDGWVSKTLSLERWKGQRVAIWLFVEAGGKRDWCDEYGAVKTFRIVQ